MDKTIIQDYGKYLSKVNPEKGRRRAQEQEAKWAEERKKREEEKLTEAYQRELRERAEQAARERRKVEKATAAFNAASEAHGTKSNAPDKRQLREIREGISVIANPTTPFRSPDELMSKKYGGQDIRRVLPELDTKDVINRRYGIGENPNYSNYGYAYKTHDLSDEEKVRQWTNPDYKLSDKEKREAKDILKREKERRNNVIKQGSIDAMIPGTEEYNRLQQYNNLEAKTKGEFARGALLPFLKVSNLATKGVEKLMGDSEDAQNAKSILDEQMQNAFKQDRLAAAQSPIKHGAGNFAGTAAMYSATSPIFDALAEGLGVSSTVGKFLINQLAQNAQDVALDTAPERQMLRDMGMSEEEINRETLKNVRNNAIGNVAMPVLGKLASTAVDAFKGNLPQLGDSLPKVDMDEFRQGIAKLQGINDNALTPEKQTIEALGDTTKQIEDAVQRQTAEAQKVLKEAEPIEEWTRKQLSSTGRETAKDIKVLAQEAALRNKDESTYKAIDNLVKKSDDLDNAITSGADASEIRKIYSDVKKAYNTLNGKLKAVGDNSLEAKKSTYFGKNSEFNVDDILKRKPADSDDFSELFDDTIPADNVKPTSVGDSAPTNSYTSSVEKAIDGYREALSWYDNKDIHPTSRKSIDRLKTALDKVAESAKAGDNAGFRENYDEFRKALTRVNENMAEKDGVDYFRDAFKGDINPKSEQNLMKLYNDAMYQKGLDDLDIDEDGFIIPKEDEDLPFNEIEYDKYGRVMLDDEGIPKRRRGVDVSQDVGTSIRQNMDVADPDDRITSELVTSATRGNTMEKSPYYSKYDLEEMFPEEDAKYFREQEKIPYEEARDYVVNNFDKALAEYTQKTKNSKDALQKLGGAKNVNAMHLLNLELAERIENASSPEEARLLNAQLREVSRNLYKVNRGGGRTIQANAKFSRTAEGTLQNARAYAEGMVEDALKINPKLGGDIEQASRQIESWLDAMEDAELRREDIEQMVKDAIRQRSRLNSKISDGDIKKITDAILNEKQYADVQHQLEFLSQGFEDIDADTLDKVSDIFERAYKMDYNSKERVDLEAEAYALLAQKIAPHGGKLGDKFDAWRYLMMLGNPLTIIKNKFGNRSFGALVGAKNSLAAMIEAGADRVSKATGHGGIDRTKSILTPNDKSLVDLAEKDAYQNSWRDLAGSKYEEVGSAIDNAIPAFDNTKWVGRKINKASDRVGNRLSKDDEIAKVAKYKTSLAGFLKANGADESIFNATDKASKELLDSARAYAINQAKEATHNQDNGFSKWYGKTTRSARESSNIGMRALGTGLDTVVPFKRTPANILKSAFAYSPAEVVKIVTSDIAALKRGADRAGNTFKAANLIDDIAKATVGTTGALIGGILAHEGIIKVGNGDTDREQAFDKQTGRTNFSIKVKVGKGNNYVDVTELMPTSASVIMGAMMYNTYAAAQDGESALNIMRDGLSAISDSMTDMTMLSGIMDVANYIKYADGNTGTAMKLIEGVATNAIGQMLPTVGRKINTTIDPISRSTYSDKTGLMKQLDQEAKYWQTKVPGLQQAGEAMQKSDIPFLQKVGDRLALEPNIDAKGQIIESPGFAGFNNIGGRALNNFAVPLQTKRDTSDAYDDERRRLSKATGNDAVIPYISSKEANISGVGQLTPKQWTEYRQQRGQMREELAKLAIDSDIYKSASDADKANLLTEIDDFTKAYSQSKYGGEIGSYEQSLAEAYKKSPQDALNMIATKSMVSGTGLHTDSEVYKSIQEAYEGGDIKKAKELTDTVKELKAYGVSLSSADLYQGAKQKLPQLTVKQFANMYKTADADGNGSLKQDEIISLMNSDKKHAKTYQKALWKDDWKKTPVLNGGKYVASGSNNSSKSTGKSSKDDKAAWVKQLNSGEGDIGALIEQNGYKNHVADLFSAAKKRNPNITADEYISAFKAADTNGNGGVTQAEIKDLMKRDPQNADRYYSMLWSDKWKKKLK